MPESHGSTRLVSRVVKRRAFSASLNRLTRRRAKRSAKCTVDGASRPVPRAIPRAVHGLPSSSHVPLGSLQLRALEHDRGILTTDSFEVPAKCTRCHTDHRRELSDMWHRFMLETPSEILTNSALQLVTG